MNESLAGFVALAAVLLEVAKRAGWLPDGWGGKVALFVNAGILALGVFAGQVNYDLSDYNAVAQTVARLVTQLIALFGVSWLTWKGLKVTGLAARE